jgi:hypothetical protein
LEILNRHQLAALLAQFVFLQVCSHSK